LLHIPKTIADCVGKGETEKIGRKEAKGRMRGKTRGPIKRATKLTGDAKLWAKLKGDRGDWGRGRGKTS